LTAELLHSDGFVAKSNRLPGGTRRTNRPQTCHWKTPSFEHVQKILTDRASRPDDRDVITFHQQPDSIAGPI
jgi:hypothetical protein